jgi:hypothetical protein
LSTSSDPESNTTVTSDDSTGGSLDVNKDSASREHLQDPESTTPRNDTSLSLSTSSIPESNTTVTSDNITAAFLAINNDSTSREPQQDPESTTPRRNDTSQVTTPPMSAMMDSGMDATVDALPSASTHQTSNPDSMDVDQEIGEESINVVGVAAPAWLTAHNMDVYLQECSNVKGWQMLVQSLYKFEMGNAIKGVRHYICIVVFRTNFLPLEFTNHFTS